MNQEVDVTRGSHQISQEGDWASVHWPMQAAQPSAVSFQETGKEHVARAYQLHKLTPKSVVMGVT